MSEEEKPRRLTGGRITVILGLLVLGAVGLGFVPALRHNALSFLALRGPERVQPWALRHLFADGPAGMLLAYRTAEAASSERLAAGLPPLNESAPEAVRRFAPHRRNKLLLSLRDAWRPEELILPLFEDCPADSVARSGRVALLYGTLEAMWRAREEDAARTLLSQLAPRFERWHALIAQDARLPQHRKSSPANAWMALVALEDALAAGLDTWPLLPRPGSHACAFEAALIREGALAGQIPPTDPPCAYRHLGPAGLLVLAQSLARAEGADFERVSRAIATRLDAIPGDLSAEEKHAVAAALEGDSRALQAIAFDPQASDDAVRQASQLAARPQTQEIFALALCLRGDTASGEFHRLASAFSQRPRPWSWAAPIVLSQLLAELGGSDTEGYESKRALLEATGVLAAPARSSGRFRETVSPAPR